MSHQLCVCFKSLQEFCIVKQEVRGCCQNSRLLCCCGAEWRAPEGFSLCYNVFFDNATGGCQKKTHTHLSLSFYFLNIDYELFFNQTDLSHKPTGLHSTVFPMSNYFHCVIIVDLLEVNYSGIVN